MLDRGYNRPSAADTDGRRWSASNDHHRATCAPEFSAWRRTAAWRLAWQAPAMTSHGARSRGQPSARSARSSSPGHWRQMLACASRFLVDCFARQSRPLAPFRHSRTIVATRPWLSGRHDHNVDPAAADDLHSLLCSATSPISASSTAGQLYSVFATPRREAGG